MIKYLSPLCAPLMALAACSSDGGDPADGAPPIAEPGYTIERQVPSGTAPGLRSAECIYASPIAYERAGVGEAIVTAGDVVVGMDPQTGETLWTAELPEPVDGQRAFAAGTPALVGDLLVVGYQTRPLDTDVTALDPEAEGRGADFARSAHYVAVVDLANKRIDDRFAPLELTARLESNGGTIEFLASNAFGRASIAHIPGEGGALGRAYVSFGNVRDIQPWHGWLFEVDLDQWRDAGEPERARSAVFVSTPEPDCGAPGRSGSRERICGGGFWSPTGPLVTPTDPPRLIVAAGNGQLDLARNDYANTLLKFGPDLSFEPGCDAQACANFNPDAPSRTCAASCENLFIPRTLPNEEDPRPADGSCDGLSFFECWQERDYIGGSTPAYLEVEGQKLLAYPTKDGHLYLVDFDKLGVMHDRHQLVAYCGTPDDACRWSWAGMIVTQPAVVEIDGRPRILVATFMPDRTHPAGVVALDVVIEAGEPKLERAWEYPNFSSPEAVERFRTHPTNIRVATIFDRQIAWLAEARVDGGELGRLIGLDVESGEPIVETPMAGRGYRFTTPLVIGQNVLVNSCEGNAGPGTIESYRFERAEITQ